MESNNQKDTFFNKLNNNLKLQFIFFISVSTVLILTFFIINHLIDTSKFRTYRIVDDIKLINSVENMTLEKDKFLLKGYAFYNGIDTNESNISVFLKSVTYDKEIWLDVEQTPRPDVNSYYKCDYNYENSGFLATGKTNKLKTDECYEVFINIDYLNPSNAKIRRTVSSNQYIVNNKLYDYNPFTFDKPDLNVKSDLLQDVFSNGKLCFYQSDIGMYVYQHNGKLYWIATPDFNFNNENLTQIIYHLNTSQVEKLPEYRIQYKFDNLDFIFEEYEYVDEDTSPYRVAIRKIPNQYSITYITTGVYDKFNRVSLWNKSFHLDVTSSN